MNNFIIKPILYATVLLLVMLIFERCFSDISLDEVHAKARELFQKKLVKEDVHNAFLRVYSSSLQINWEFVGGQFQNGEPVTEANPFYTASIGKTFTATAIAILVEQGKLRFEEKISQYLPDSIMENLHVFEGNEYSGKITLAQLLQHTSGLPDYFEGTTVDGSPNVMELLFDAPERFWKPVEMIRFAKEKMQPLSVPGTNYHYTDTEYVLLGLIVENVSGVPLPDFFKTHFFAPLEMEHTYMFLRSEPLGEIAKIAEVYAGDYEVSAITSLSADWAGGGLVSTGNDLVRFQQELFSGKIISEKTLEKMQNWMPETHGMEYGLGLRKIVFKELFPALPDLTAIGHSGSTGSFLFFCPELDVYIAGTLNQTDEVKSSVLLMAEVLALIQKAQKQ